MSSDSSGDQDSARTILQVSASSLSFIASLCIIVMILISPKKLTSPYGRIIFGMSFGDVVQSLAMLTGPFSVSSINACNWNGFAFTCGTIAVPLYMFTLSLRYFCKLNLKMSDEKFARKIERWIHLVVIVFVLSTCIAGLVMKLYNPMPSEAVCFFEEYPTGCLKDPETYGECERGMQSFNFVIAVSFVLCLCLVGVTINMTMLCINSCWIERTYSNRTQLSTSVHSSDRSSARDYLRCLSCWNYNQLPQEADSDYVLRLYRMETIIQSTLYVGAFYVSYLPPVLQSIFSMVGVRLPSIILLIISFFYPLGGFLNVMVYVRPKVVRIRHGIPGCSRLRAFLVVLKNGGEMPDLESDPNAMKICIARRSNTNIEDTNEISNLSFGASRNSLFNMLVSFSE